MAVLAKRNGENIATKKLGESMKTVDKKIRNLMNAIEEGIVTATAKQRLQELEVERDELRARLVAEESHDKPQITKSDIKLEPEKMKYGKSAVSGVVKMKMKLYA